MTEQQQPERETVSKPQRKKTTIIGGETMPKGQRTPSDAESVYVKFTEPEDLRVLAKLKAEAKAERRDLSVYVMLKLLSLYPATEVVSD